MGLSPEFGVVKSSHLMASPALMDLGKSADKEEVLARRYLRKNLFQQDLVFEFTRDSGLLHQYYEIRTREYGSVYKKFFHANGEYFTDGEDDYDRNGHILIVRMGNFCVGGARLNVRSPRKPVPLPMETNDFKLEEWFPVLRHKQMTYGQIGAFALLPEFRGGDVTKEMFRRLRSKFAALSMDVVFAMAAKLNARQHKRVCDSLGVESEIFYDLNLPAYPHMEEIKFYLLSISEEPFAATNKPGELIHQNTETHSDLISTY